jgi:hypothetical protein
LWFAWNVADDGEHTIRSSPQRTETQQNKDSRDAHKHTVFDSTVNDGFSTQLKKLLDFVVRPGQAMPPLYLPVFFWMVRPWDYPQYNSGWWFQTMGNFMGCLPYYLDPML